MSLQSVGSVFCSSLRVCGTVCSVLHGISSGRRRAMCDEARSATASCLAAMSICYATNMEGRQKTKPPKRAAGVLTRTSPRERPPPPLQQRYNALQSVCNRMLRVIRITGPTFCLAAANAYRSCASLPNPGQKGSLKPCSRVPVVQICSRQK